jgi:hypothetical protein
LIMIKLAAVTEKEKALEDFSPLVISVASLKLQRLLLVQFGLPFV